VSRIGKGAENVAKRGNGEGSIYPVKDKNGRVVGYRGSYWVHTAEGPKRRYLSGKKREDVADKLARALSNRADGLIFDAGDLTVGKYLKRWLTDSVRGSVRPSTYESYRRQVERYVIAAVGRIKLMKLTHMHVQGLYRQMQDRGLSARTVQYTHAVLHRALKQAVRWTMVPRNVCEAVDVPQVRREEMRPLNAEQARRLLRAANGERLEAFYVLAVHTGMRPGELLGLRWEDVTLTNAGGTLRVNWTLSDGELTTPKTKGSRRRIKLSAGSIAALRAHRKRQLEEMMQRAGLWQDHGLVFPSSVGTPLSHRNLVRAFKALLKRAGLPSSIRLYDLRHTCATLLLSRNVHPKYVQELLGHASIAQTLDTYSHIIEGMDGGTTDAIEEALG
jgi:integrase